VTAKSKMSIKNNIRYLLKRGGVISFLLLVLLCFQYVSVRSATIDELRDQILKVTQTKQELEQEIAVYEKQLKDIGDQTISLKDTIKSLDATINKNSLDIKLTQSNIDTTQLEIEELSINIGKNVSSINKNVKVITLLLNQLKIHDNTSLIENLLIYRNLSELWNEQQNIYLLQNQLREKIIETKNIKISLENNKTIAEKKKKELQNYKFNLIDRKKVLDITKQEKNKLLADTKNSEANYKKILADKKIISDALYKELLQFESELKFTIDPNSIPSGEVGILSWPVNKVRITQRFGMTEFAKTGFYKGSPHNGVDFGAFIGTDVKAALSGIVRGTGDTDLVCPRASFGKWILIEHSNGLSTLYGHLSLIKVSEGDIVVTGDTIGFSGNTGYSTGPHLHLSAYATEGVKITNYKSKVPGCGTYRMPMLTKKGAYLDPMLYLPSL
jgi:murein DD-endopeptidase MepM/ murein hydrolase activator NlpD